MPKYDENDLLTPAEAGKELRTAVQTLAHWRARGTGPVFLRIGGRVFYERRSIAGFKADARRYSTTARSAGREAA